MQHENQAAMALYLKPDNIKSTLHFDATSRSQIDGDWPALILVFSDHQRYSLRPLILPLRTAKILSGLLLKHIRGWRQLLVFPPKELVEPVQLWKNTNSIMTDSVSKNLKIGEEVSKVFESNVPPPIHLLCKSHPVEAFDRSNLTVLAKIETKLDSKKSFKN